MYRWMFLGFLLICLFGCLGTGLNDKIQKGPLSQRELQIEKGTPQSVQETPTGHKIHQYPDGESFQIKEGRVTYYYRNPTTQEESLQYWLNRWKDDVYHFTSVEEGKSLTDVPSNLHYINYDNNERFIYSQAVQKVVRVNYELDTENKK